MGRCNQRRKRRGEAWEGRMEGRLEVTFGQLLMDENEMII